MVVLYDKIYVRMIKSLIIIVCVVAKKTFTHTEKQPRVDQKYVSGCIHKHGGYAILSST